MRLPTRGLLIALAVVLLLVVGCGDDESQLRGEPGGHSPADTNAPAGDADAGDGDEAEGESPTAESSGDDAEVGEEAARGEGELAAFDRRSGETTADYWHETIQVLWLPGDAADVSDADLLARWADAANSDLAETDHAQVVETAEAMAEAEHTGGDLFEWSTMWDPASPPRRMPPKWPGFEIAAIGTGSANPDGRWVYAGVVFTADDDPWDDEVDGFDGYGWRLYVFERADGEWRPRPCHEVADELAGGCLRSLGP